MTAQPLNQSVGTAAARSIERRPPFPVWNPVRNSAPSEQIFGSISLPTMTSVPKGMVDLFGCWRCFIGKMRFDAFHQSQGRRMCKCRARSAFNQSRRGLPLPKRHRVGQRCVNANHCTGRFNVGARVEQRVQHRNVIAACGPMKRRLGVWAGKPGVDICSSLNQCGDGRRAVRKMSWPVRGDVQQRPRNSIATLWVADSRRCQTRIGFQHDFQRCHIALVYGLNHGDGERIVGRDVQRRAIADWLPALERECPPGSTSGHDD